VPVIDPADIAAVAAARLLDDRHTGGVYELTGPEVITPRRQSANLAVGISKGAVRPGLDLRAGPRARSRRPSTLRGLRGK
jgi:uncharacterized protein YbjT (DUF2867 family)